MEIVDKIYRQLITKKLFKTLWISRELNHCQFSRHFYSNKGDRTEIIEIVLISKGE